MPKRKRFYDIFICEEVIVMEYRQLPHGNEKISVIGLGTSSLGESSEEEIITTIQEAMENGINY